MDTRFTRRRALLGGLTLAACAPRPEETPSWPEPPALRHPRLYEIEQYTGGRLGVLALDTGTGHSIGHRWEERFAMCSTFKWLLAARMLHLDTQQPGLLDQRVEFSERDLLEYAPSARANVARGWMSVAEMSEAIVVTSDNTCANLLLGRSEGPAGLTRFLREHGDRVTRLDRIEPEMNIVLAGDERDTTTPEAMSRTLERFLVRNGVLNASSRERLIGWMVSATTGLQRLRAGLPGDWRVGDKTGTWVGDEGNATNDVAIAWPPGRAPIVISCYLANATVDTTERNAAHADVARVVTETWG